jgi:metal-sulfur cluster biosynthetic enzyme
MTPSMPDESAVRDALATVEDPEAGMNIVDLGLVYEVEVAGDAIRIDLTMTTPACPVADLIVEQAAEAVDRLAPPDAKVQIRLVWDPPWTPSMMSGVARDHFGWK